VSPPPTTREHLVAEVRQGTVAHRTRGDAPPLDLREAGISFSSPIHFGPSRPGDGSRVCARTVAPELDVSTERRAD
jgi:hypothetical protein